MPTLLAVLVLALLVWTLWPRIQAWKASSDAERAFATRFTVFAWLVGFLFVLAFLFLPYKGRIVMLLPVFLVAVSLAKWWKNSRARLRREAGLDANFERARRIN